MKSLNTMLAIIALLAPAAATASFPRIELPLERWKLYDLGVTDVDGDGRLDPFTVNHKFDASLLRNTRDGWVDVYDRIGLAPTPAFPGFESIRSLPPLKEPGLYVYAEFNPAPGDPFHLRTIDRAASGTATFAARRVRIERTERATADLVHVGGRTEIRFDIAPGGWVEVSVDHHDLPLRVDVDPPLPASEIRVGAEAVPARSRSFDLRLRDRHGYGFADFDGDRRLDVLIAAGGLGGNLLDPFYAGTQSDELLLRRGGVLADRASGSGLEKGTCRSRSVDLADLDGDGNLDVVVGCEDAPPKVSLGSGTGTFSPFPSTDVAADALTTLDVSGDRRPELLTVTGSTADVWSLAGPDWKREKEIHLLNWGGRVSHITRGDIDGDGRLDALLLSARGNTLLINRAGGDLRRRSPTRRLRLPRRGSVAGAFVDYDNDGDLDVDLLPQGLFERTAKRYRRTRRLAYGPLPQGPVRSGIVQWADLDGDGRRDLLSARGRGAFASDQILDLRRNRTRSSGAWLQLDLRGPAGNREAIGAKVEIRSRGSRQVAWVGQSDDSAHSSGHYRVYFGLGRMRPAQRVGKLVVLWPDGAVTSRRGVRPNRLLLIPHPDAI